MASVTGSIVEPAKNYRVPPRRYTLDGSRNAINLDTAPIPLEGLNTTI